MPQVVIDKPIINSPFVEPTRHYRFGDEGITNELVDGRRDSSYFIPIPGPKKKGGQLHIDTGWTQDRIKPNDKVNEIRERVARWRKGSGGVRYRDVTAVTRRLLDYWTDPRREKKLFFCQIEALETAIYITEVADKYGDAWITNHLREANDSSNPGLNRMALKMATGSGKTVVMAMLIAWHTLNKLANPQAARYSDTFLVITPGITIRDRLRVLLPNDPQNYYRERDVVPSELMEQLCRARILITNFHLFKLRETGDAARLTKAILSQGGQSAFTENPDQMVRRVCRDFGNKKSVLILNDEAHHCYRRKPAAEEEHLTGEERTEAAKRDEEARVWISGIEAVKAKFDVRGIYDLSATPFFLKGSGYSEGDLFPWVVSDFSLIDAIEAGIVKVPRVPVADNSMVADQPTYRDLWFRIRESLPRKGRKTESVGGEPQVPKELEGAIESLYANYRKYYELWLHSKEAQEKGITPPVFIVVCNNTNVSKLVFDYVSGWEKVLSDGTRRVVAGKLPIFNNEEDGRWSARPNTILVDSEQLESDEGMNAEFKKIAAGEIEEFKAEYRQRTGREPEDLTDEDLLREVMNTVGKKGKLGEHVKCVVSVSMLTEGWDANTVTHVLGVRAFGTQLLCEQVVGRALRRRSYATNEQGLFEAEYAEVYGVPFSFIPCSGSTKEPVPGPMPTHVRALEQRIRREITFPRVLGYRFDLEAEPLTAAFSEDSRYVLSTADLPTKTENAPIIGLAEIHTLDDFKAHRESEVAFLLAKRTLERYFRCDPATRPEPGPQHQSDADVQAWRFPQVLKIAREWLSTCVECKDATFKQLLLFRSLTDPAVDRIYRAIVAGVQGKPALKPILRPYDTIGSTRLVDFDTTKPTYSTRPDKCHVSHVVADTESWEQKMAQALEEMDEVFSYVKNHNLGFTIPYTIDGEEHQYSPDFLAWLDDGHGTDDPLKLIIEVTGQRRNPKAAKASTARGLWVRAINNHGGFGRWAFLEVTDPWDAQSTIRGSLRTAAVQS